MHECWQSSRSRAYVPFFFRSAHRFFIANDSRLLPSGVIPPRLFPFDAVTATAIFLAVRGEFDASSAAIARLSLSLSCFSSPTILSRSKVRSFLLSSYPVFLLCIATILNSYRVSRLEKPIL
jgi:hypothetical protein